MEGEKGRWGISLLALAQPVSLLCLSPINEGKMYTAHVHTGQDKAIKNCSPDHDRGGVKIQKKVRIASSGFSHLPSNFSYA